MSKKKGKRRSSTIKKTPTHPQGLFVSGRVVYFSGAVLGVLLLVAFVQTSSQRASLQFDSPTKVLGAAGYVLGDDDNSGGKKEEEKKEEEKKENEEQKKVEEQQKEETKKADERQKKADKSSNSIINSLNKGSRAVTPTRSVKFKIQSEGDKTETESETSDGQKVKVKTEDDGTTKIEIEHGELKIKYKIVDGQVVKKVEDEQGEEVDLDEDEVAEVEDEVNQDLEDQGIELSSESGRPSFRHNNVTASTQFPLSVDVGTNQLIVTTAAGSKAVAVLPDEALQVIMLRRIIDQGASTSNTQTQIGTGDQTQVVLKVLNDKPVYEVNGTKEYKFLAFIPVTQPIKAVVSAESGQVVGVEKSFVTNFIDLLSP